MYQFKSNSGYFMVVFLGLALLHGCKSKSTIGDIGSIAKPSEPVTSSTGTLVFKNGFEGTTSIEYKGPNHDLIRGSDLTSAPDDWVTDLEQNPYFGTAQITYEQGDPSLRKAEIVPDPENSNNKVIRFRITDQHILLASGERKSRIQYDLQNKKVAPPGGYLKEYYQKVRLYFSPNFSVLQNAGTDNIGWFAMQEFWNDPQWDAPLSDGTFRARSQARTGVELVRKGGKLHFGVKGRYPENIYPATWEVLNTNFEIPLGKWITQEIYVKEGDHTSGRFYLSVTVDGVKTVLVDKTGMTTSVKPGYVADGQTSWNPIKVYTEGKVLSWFKSQNKTMDVYWDDLEIWKDRRPEKN